MYRPFQNNSLLASGTKTGTLFYFSVYLALSQLSCLFPPSFRKEHTLDVPLSLSPRPFLSLFCEILRIMFVSSPFLPLFPPFLLAPLVACRPAIGGGKEREKEEEGQFHFWKVPPVASTAVYGGRAGFATGCSLPPPSLLLLKRVSDNNQWTKPRNFPSERGKRGGREGGNPVCSTEWL